MAPALLARVQSPVGWLLAAARADGEEHLRIRICEGEESESAAEELGEAAPDADVERELKRRLAFVYPHREAEALPSKLTATGLKDRYQPDEEAVPLMPRTGRPFRLPDLSGEEKPLTAAERGTATHLVLQNLDFSKTDSEETLRGEILRLREARFLSAREAQAVDAGAILRLFASPLGKRLREAEGLRREFRFSLLCDASDFFPTSPGEQVLLQGVVDCFLEEEGQLVILDYKTDRVGSRAEAEERAQTYTGQLRAYAGALARIFRKPVRECLLYFLHAGETVEVSF